MIWLVIYFAGFTAVLALAAFMHQGVVREHKAAGTDSPRLDFVGFLMLVGFAALWPIWLPIAIFIAFTE